MGYMRPYLKTKQAIKQKQKQNQTEKKNPPFQTQTKEKPMWLALKTPTNTEMSFLKGH